MLIGLDFDNTLASYDKVFRYLAFKNKLIDSEWKGNKSQLKNYLCSFPNGEYKWQKLQGKAYGKYMHKAVLFEGVKKFLLDCKTNNVSICIVSHKTIHGIHDEEKFFLRHEALKWMHNQGFFNELGISESEVYFEKTLEQKIQRISLLNCSHFIDDLHEVISHSDFPNSVEKIHFDIDSNHKSSNSILSFNNWSNFSLEYLKKC